VSDTVLCVDLPLWVIEREREHPVLPTERDRIRFAIGLARENVRAGTGGPFGAVVVEDDAGRLVAAGVNSVVRLGSSSLHAEMVAFIRAQRRIGHYSLAASGRPSHALYASCDPCAMCLGAALSAGVRSVVCAASRADAMALGFDEGPVFPESYAYLRQRGIDVRHGVLRDEAKEVLEEYRARGGVIYNA
jgi:tRNA(Arg) A34 adenosine deaminase TadA